MAKFADQLRSFQVKVEGLANETARRAVLEAYSRVVARSPVDSGRFRGAWSCSTDTIVARDPGPAAVGGAFPPPGLPALPPRVIGHVHYIANNVPYAIDLEYGSSKQAPQGMVGVVVAEWPSIVRAAVLAARGNA